MWTGKAEVKVHGKLEGPVNATPRTSVLGLLGLLAVQLCWFHRPRACGSSEITPGGSMRLLLSPPLGIQGTGIFGKGRSCPWGQLGNNVAISRLERLVRAMPMLMLLCYFRQDWG